MNPRRVRFTAAFTRDLRKLSPDLQTTSMAAVAAFIDRSAENSLRPERKSGLEGVWAFRVTRGVRVFYTQESDERGAISELIGVGQHDDYRTIARRR